MVSPSISTASASGARPGDCPRWARNSTLPSLPVTGERITPRRPHRRYLFLYTAALFAAREDLHAGAYLFQDAATREAAKVAAVGVLT